MDRENQFLLLLDKATPRLISPLRFQGRRRLVMKSNKVIFLPTTRRIQKQLRTRTSSPFDLVCFGSHGQKNWGSLVIGGNIIFIEAIIA